MLAKFQIETNSGFLFNASGFLYLPGSCFWLIYAQFRLFKSVPDCLSAFSYFFVAGNPILATNAATDRFEITEVNGLNLLSGA